MKLTTQHLSINFVCVMLALVASMMPGIADGFLFNGPMTCRRMRRFVKREFSVIADREIIWDCNCNNPRDSGVVMNCKTRDTSTVLATLVIVSDGESLRVRYNDKDEIYEDHDYVMNFARGNANRNVNNWAATDCTIKFEGIQCSTCIIRGTFGALTELDAYGNCRIMDSNNDEEKEQDGPEDPDD